MIKKTCKWCGNKQNVEDWRTCWPCHACSRVNEICIEEADNDTIGTIIDPIDDYMYIDYKPEELDVNVNFNPKELEDDREEE